MTHKTIPERVAALEVEVASLKLQLSSKVGKDAFSPVERIAYGAAGIILALFMTALVYVVLKR